MERIYCDSCSDELLYRGEEFVNQRKPIYNYECEYCKSKIVSDTRYPRVVEKEIDD